jgi:hypothetical protein
MLKRKRNAPAWEYMYSKEDKVCCTKCNWKSTRKDSSTSHMNYHLLKQHNICVGLEQQKEKIDQFFSKNASSNSDSKKIDYLLVISLPLLIKILGKMHYS